MRHLLQPQVLKQAFVASVFTTAACYPRLAMWPDAPHALSFILLIMGWATFVLWSFVFAWHRHLGHVLFDANAGWRMMGLATACGLAGAIFLHTFIDPVLRRVAPQDYPDSVESWAAMALFAISFDPLFLCFAPLAFFARLFRNARTAAGLTVLFGVLLVYLQARSRFSGFTSLFLITMFAWRIGTGFLTIYFYVRSGVALTLWWVFLLQLRHLIVLCA